MDNWGVQFAKTVAHRLEGQSDFALDLIDLLQAKAAEFNSASGEGFGFYIKVKVDGENVEVTNGYKSAAANAVALPGTIFLRIWNPHNERGFEGSLHNSPDGFDADGVPSECADPDKLAEWMIHEIFEP